MNRHPHRREKLRDLLARMSLDELKEGQRLMQSEIDRRQGREKFEPITQWPDMLTRG